MRRRRKADGRLFGVAVVKDSDRGIPREWRVYVNDLELIERLEEMRIGEPVALSGPFSFEIEGGHIACRITAEAILDTKRRRKPKGVIGKEQRTESNEFDLAPQQDDGERPFNDGIPF
jgi:hypothetical protein